MFETDTISYASQIGLLKGERKRDTEFKFENYLSLCNNIVKDINEKSKNTEKEELIKLLRQTLYFIFYTTVEYEYSLSKNNSPLNYEYNFEDILDCSIRIHSNIEMTHQLSDEIESIKVLFEKISTFTQREKYEIDYTSELICKIGVRLGYEYYLRLPI